MAFLFDRRVSVLLRSAMRSGDVLTLSGTARRITDLRVVFSLEKTSESSSNRSRISIFNVNPDTRALLEMGTVDESVTTVMNFAVGYKEVFEEVFNGNVTKAVTTTQGPDTVTELEVGDGDFVLRNARLNKTYAAGALVQTVVTDLVRAMGLEPGDLTLVGPDRFLQGHSVSGAVKGELDQIMETRNLEWSIQEGVFQLTRANGSNEEPVPRLTPETGLVGSPNKTDKGVEIVALMQPKLGPKRRVIIESNIISGTFLANKVTHEGDTHGNNWFTKIEATPL